MEKQSNRVKKTGAKTQFLFDSYKKKGDRKIKLNIFLYIYFEKFKHAYIDQICIGITYTKKNN